MGQPLSSIVRCKLLHRHPHQQHHARPGQDQLRLHPRKAPQGRLLRLQAPSGQGDHLPLERQAKAVLAQAGEGQGVPGRQAVAHHPPGFQVPGQRPQAPLQEQRPAGQPRGHRARDRPVRGHDQQVIHTPGAGRAAALPQPRRQHLGQQVCADRAPGQDPYAVHPPRPLFSP